MRIKVKPASAGLIVRLPELGYSPVPDTGAEVERTTTVVKRINEGSLVEVVKAVSAKKEKE